VLRDSFVDKVSNRYYHTASWFLLAHEVGHVALGHDGPSTIDQENAADDFAIDVMRRKRLVPAGAVLYMTVVAFYDRKIANRTHAENGDRLRRVADALRRSPQDFVAIVENGVPVSKEQQARDTAAVQRMADELSKIADALKLIRKAEIKREKDLAGSGKTIDNDYREDVFKAVDYKRACAARQ
jgi:hypothetical protein